jgi:integrase
MKLTYKFYVRKVTISEKDSYYVSLRVTLGRKHIYKNIVKVSSPAEFSPKLELIKGKSPTAVEGNLLIKKYKDIIKELLFQSYYRSEPLTLKKIKKALDGDIGIYEDFFAYCYQELLPRKQKELRYGGYKKYLTEVNKIKEFSPRLSFADIDEKFAREYFDFLINVKHNNKNTAHRAIRQLKAILNAAVRDGQIPTNPLAGYKTKQIKGNMQYLTLEELKQFHAVVINLKNRSLRNVGLYFLFACYTGLRYSDVRQLKWRHIEGNIIRLKMIKTRDEIFIPLNHKAMSILSMQEHQGEAVPVFKVLTNQKTNEALKKLANLAGINKRLSFHVARHTFATVSLTLGIPLEVVSKLLGHHDIKTTMIYARVIDQVKMKEMEKWNNF